MNDSIQTLYETFAAYRIDNDLMKCSCFMSLKDYSKLTSSPLRKLAYTDLESYSRKAISTWGNAEHFKYFLPRLFELSIEHRDDFLDLAVVFGKLDQAHFYSWPKREQDAVNQFFVAYWDYQLREPIFDSLQDSADTVLCALSNALPSVQIFLEKWIATPTDNAKRHLGAFLLCNETTLFKRGKLANPFWDPSGKQHQEVIDWLQSDSLVSYFDEDSDLSTDDFSYTRPRLMAIRSAIADNQK